MSKKLEIVETSLSQSEMDLIEKRNLEKRLREAQVREIDLNRQLIQVKFNAAKHEKDYELLKCDKIKTRLIEITDSKNKEHREYIDTLRDKYKITGNFGYNPDTGELVRED